MKAYTGLPIRGVHMDLKAYTMSFEMMCRTARKLAGLGFNTILLEYQDKFPYEGALADIPDPDALTRAQIVEFRGLCASLELMIIPVVQCLGHMRYVLRREKYAHLGDSYKPAHQADVLCPSREESYALFAAMAAQVMELHPESRYFHMGGDEAWLSGHCPVCGDRPRHERLMGHYRKCVEQVIALGKKPILWGDMLLAHPELLDELRGKVVVMDWNYSSTGTPGERAQLWGGLDPYDPDAWPELHQRLFRKYVYTCEPYLMNPFPYVRFLQDQGFEVIVAPAAQCAGDSFYAPQPHHIKNCRAAVRAAAEADALGVIVTVWSVRRVPWPMIEHCLVATALTLADPGVSDRQVDLAIARECFGSGDAELAQIPALLGTAAQELRDVCDVATQVHREDDIGKVSDYAMNWAARGQETRDASAVIAVCRKLAAAAGAAQELLDRATPGPEQRLTVQLWQLAIGTAQLMSGYVPLLSAESIGSDTAARYMAAFESLGGHWREALAPLYTAQALESDLYARAGLHMEYLRRFI